MKKIYVLRGYNENRVTFFEIEAIIQDQPHLYTKLEYVLIVDYFRTTKQSQNHSVLTEGQVEDDWGLG